MFALINNFKTKTDILKTYCGKRLNNHYYKKDYLLTLFFDLKKYIWHYPYCIKINNPDQILCNRLVNHNPDLFEYISRHNITNKMLSIVSRKKSFLLDRLDLNDNIMKLKKHSNNKNDELSPIAICAFREVVRNNEQLIHTVHPRYAKLILPNTSIPNTSITNTSITNTSIPNIKNSIYKSIEQVINILEYEKVIPKAYNYNKDNSIVINKKHINQELCTFLFDYDNSFIEQIPIEYVTQYMILSALKKNVYDYFIIKANIPRKYIRTTINVILERNPELVEYMNNKQLKVIKLKKFISLIKINPSFIKYVPNKWKTTVLRLQESDFYSKKNLNKLDSIILPSDFFIKYFGHITMYEVYDMKMNRITNLQNGSKYFKLSDTSLTWDPDWIANKNNLNPYAIKEYTIPSKIKIQIKSEIKSVLFLQK